MKRRVGTKHFVLCVSNRGYKASLIARKVYEQVPDREASEKGLVRIVDESGEDYLFPSKLFAAIELPREVRLRLAT
jgi:hypothetical protein